MNVCNFMGKLTRNPEFATLNNGKSVVNFSIAVKKPNAGKDNKNAEATFIDCVAWEGTAELINKYFKKGSRILINAVAKTDTWTDKETGKNRYKIKFLVQKFWYVDQKPKDAVYSEPEVTEEIF